MSVKNCDCTKISQISARFLVRFLSLRFRFSYFCSVTTGRTKKLTIVHDLTTFFLRADKYTDYIFVVVKLHVYEIHRALHSRFFPLFFFVNLIVCAKLAKFMCELVNLTRWNSVQNFLWKRYWSQNNIKEFYNTINIIKNLFKIE